MAEWSYVELPDTERDGVAERPYVVLPDTQGWSERPTRKPLSQRIVHTWVPIHLCKMFCVFCFGPG